MRENPWVDAERAVELRGHIVARCGLLCELMLAAVGMIVALLSLSAVCEREISRYEPREPALQVCPQRAAITSVGPCMRRTMTNFPHGSRCVAHGGRW